MVIGKKFLQKHFPEHTFPNLRSVLVTRKNDQIIVRQHPREIPATTAGSHSKNVPKPILEGLRLHSLSMSGISVVYMKQKTPSTVVGGVFFYLKLDFI